MTSRPDAAGGNAPVQLTWDQVLTWRIMRHCLDKRAPHGALSEVIATICCLHAQLLSSAELSLWARVEGIESGEVEQLLWDDRRLVKTWAMRGTLHLLPTEEYPLWQGALSAYRHYLKPSWLRAFGVTEEELETMLAAVGEALNGRLLTREELATTVAELTGAPKTRSLLQEDSWGALLKPASFRGYLCFAPNEGQNVRFTAPRSWLGDFEPMPTDLALAEMTGRYLSAYGPATRDDYGRWSAHTPAQAGRMIKELGDEVTEVDVEGTRGWMRTEDAEHAAGIAASRAVRLLPAFDPWVIGAPRHVDEYCPQAHHDRVYRKQGWISPVVLVNGRMQAVWRYEARSTRVVVSVAPFDDLPKWAREGVEEEAEHLAGFVGRGVELVWS
jgi:hypothetical protein